MNLSDLIKTINQETTADKRWEDPNYLSELLLKLASYYSTLGQFVADAEMEQDQAETHYKVVREQFKLEKVRDGLSDKARESYGIIESKEDLLSYIELKHKARLLFLTRQNLDKTMDAIRSRLAYLGRERDSSKHAV